MMPKGLAEAERSLRQAQGMRYAGHCAPAADPDLFLDKSKRVCLACSMELPSNFVAACGLKHRCPYCQHGYPLGDCSD